MDYMCGLLGHEYTDNSRPPFSFGWHIRCTVCGLMFSYIPGYTHELLGLDPMLNVSIPVPEDAERILRMMAMS